MLAAARLLEDPQTVDGLRVVRVELELDGSQWGARLVELPGAVFPYADGDRVLVGLLYEDARAGVVVLARYEGQRDDANDGTTRIVARDTGNLELVAEDGDVVLGTEEGGAPEQVMLHPAASDDLQQIEQQFNDLRTQVNLALTAIAGGFAGAAPYSGSGPTASIPGYSAPTASLSLSTGDPAANVLARPEGA